MLNKIKDFILNKIIEINDYIIKEDSQVRILRANARLEGMKIILAEVERLENET